MEICSDYSSIELEKMYSEPDSLMEKPYKSPISPVLGRGKLMETQLSRVDEKKKKKKRLQQRDSTVSQMSLSQKSRTFELESDFMHGESRGDQYHDSRKNKVNGFTYYGGSNFSSDVRHSDKEHLAHRLSVSELRLQPLTKVTSKTMRESALKLGSRNGARTSQFHTVTPNAIDRTRDVADGDSPATVFHAPDKLQPVRRNMKSRNDLNLDDSFTSELRLNPLSPEPLKAIPSWKSRGMDSRSMTRSMKDGF